MSGPVYKWFRPRQDESFIAHIDGYDVWGSNSWDEGVTRPIAIVALGKKRIARDALPWISYFNIIDDGQTTAFPDDVRTVLVAIFALKGW